MGVKERIGEILKAGRRAKCMSVKELSEMSGVSERAIYHAEAGETAMRADSLDLVAKALRIHIVLGGK